MSDIGRDTATTTSLKQLNSTCECGHTWSKHSLLDPDDETCCLHCACPGFNAAKITRGEGTPRDQFSSPGIRELFIRHVISFRMKNAVTVEELANAFDLPVEVIQRIDGS